MPVLILDGGMGTTLESLGCDVSSQMWGCELVSKDPSVIGRVHDGYVAAGADIIETATYQMTTEGLVAAGLSTGVMCEAVNLARGRGADVALSIGPFGSTLRPGQEYAGIYPEPYDQEDSLYEFHLERLRQYGLDSPRGYGLDVAYVAFETVPKLAEVRAIRRAMAEFDQPFWICSAFPNGQHGQKGPNGESVSVDQVVEAMVGGDLPVPRGIGINCTNPTYITQLTREFTVSIAKREARPWFVLYPDGGSVYDVVSRTWVSSTVASPDEWAERVMAVAREAESAQDEVGKPVWAGVIVGGCCKSSFEEIAALRKLV